MYKVCTYLFTQWNRTLPENLTGFTWSRNSPYFTELRCIIAFSRGRHLSLSHSMYTKKKAKIISTQMYVCWMISWCFLKLYTSSIFAGNHCFFIRSKYTYYSYVKNIYICIINYLLHVLVKVAPSSGRHCFSCSKYILLFALNWSS
jgi:hypothetical protein